MKLPDLYKQQASINFIDDNEKFISGIGSIRRENQSTTYITSLPTEHNINEELNSNPQIKVSISLPKYWFIVRYSSLGNEKESKVQEFLKQSLTPKKLECKLWFKNVSLNSRWSLQAIKLSWKFPNFKETKFG